MQINLTRAELEAARTRLAAMNIQITGDSGEITNSGVTLDYGYVEPVLVITVKHKPFIYPESAIEAKIRDWFQPGAGMR